MIPALSRLAAKIPISHVVVSVTGLVGRLGYDDARGWAVSKMRQTLADTILKRLAVRNETGSDYVLEVVAAPPEQIIALVEEAYAEGYKGGLRDAGNLG
jgi:hypothetical protein